MFQYLNYHLSELWFFKINLVFLNTFCKCNLCLLLFCKYWLAESLLKKYFSFGIWSLQIPNFFYLLWFSELANLFSEHLLTYCMLGTRESKINETKVVRNRRSSFSEPHLSLFPVLPQTEMSFQRSNSSCFLIPYLCKIPLLLLPLPFQLTGHPYHTCEVFSKPAKDSRFLHFCVTTALCTFLLKLCTVFL